MGRACGLCRAAGPDLGVAEAAIVQEIADGAADAFGIFVFFMFMLPSKARGKECV